MAVSFLFLRLREATFISGPSFGRLPGHSRTTFFLCLKLRTSFASPFPMIWVTPPSSSQLRGRFCLFFFFFFEAQNPISARYFLHISQWLNKCGYPFPDLTRLIFLVFCPPSRLLQRLSDPNPFFFFRWGTDTRKSFSLSRLSGHPGEGGLLAGPFFKQVFDLPFFFFYDGSGASGRATPSLPLAKRVAGHVRVFSSLG